jgi:diketogulonate reductase-like aldo/keto reductase
MNVVSETMKAGYRHIDTAQAYENESGVGQGIRNSGTPREDIFITTKIDGNIKNYQDAVQSIKGSLKRMELDYIDLMIIHSPQPCPQPWNEFRKEKNFFAENLEVWRALEKAYEAKKIRAIGVSDFEKRDLDNIINNSTVKPMVNQILAHVSNTPFNLIEYCQNQDILVEAYSPVAHGEILKNEEVRQLSEKYEVTIPQLCIRYCLQLDLLPLPKSQNIKHIVSNAELDFQISEEDMGKLKEIDTIKDCGKSNFFPVFSEGIAKK